MKEKHDLGGETEVIKILELFGGIGSPRCALRNIGIPVKAIDYVEIDESAVRSYNAMFAEVLPYQTQSVVGWNLKPDILIHGSPCQDMSIAGHQGKATAADGRINHGKGADEGSGTRSSLMWETIRIIDQMGIWKPKVVIWENVKNVTSKQMKKNFDRYLLEMERMGYTSNYQTLDAREFGLPQARERVFTISMLGEEKFDFDDLIRTPAQVIDCGEGRYRYLTERECWRLQGYTDEDFDRAAAVQKKTGRYTMALYKQAGNSIPVPIFESIFRKIILNETEKRGSHDNSRRHIAAD